MRTLLVAAAAWLSVGVSSADDSNAPAGEAFREGMLAGRWSSAVKQFVGTAYEAYDARNGYSDASPTAPLSKVWFTGGEGILNEIYWPSVDTPQVRDSQFLVTDGSFFFEERKDAVQKVEWLETGVPAFRVTTSDRRGRFTIEKTVFADPTRDVVLQKVRISSAVPGLRFHLLHNPAVSNTPMGNSARVVLSAGELPAGLYAWQGNQAQAVLASIPFRQVSAGFEGASDGWSDLRVDRWMDYRFETATRGNVALTGWLAVPETVGAAEFTIAIGFGSSVSGAAAIARASLDRGADALLAQYMREWRAYQSRLTDLSGSSEDGGRLFRASIAVLKSSEDKTRAGAIVASPTVPWGNHHDDKNADVLQNGSRAHQTGGYHMVWPRDLYQMATTFLAVGDKASAVACAEFLRSAQYGPSAGQWEFGHRRHTKDGSFPQNMWTNGEVYWAGLQMDETAVPVILVYRLWKEGLIDVAPYWDMIRRASDMIQEFGPWSPQERWEESFGASPSNIAAEIAALWSAETIAHVMGDHTRAERYGATANAWSRKPGDNVETWTYTTTGGLGNGRYYTRVEGASSYDQVWNPNDDQEMWVANGAGKWREKDVVDAGFLELVRLGIRPAADPAIRESLPEIDGTIRVVVPGVGAGYRRYLHDRYNYDDATGVQTDGMLWPFLSGERGHYELQLGIESGSSSTALNQLMSGYVRTMEKMATPTGMLPEQVWDYGTKAGGPTGSATPLGWTHGEYLKLLRSRRDLKVFDRLWP